MKKDIFFFFKIDKKINFNERKSLLEQYNLPNVFFFFYKLLE